jgi:hypothetical protein
MSVQIRLLPSAPKRGREVPRLFWIFTQIGSRIGLMATSPISPKDAPRRAFILSVMELPVV